MVRTEPGPLSGHPLYVGTDVDEVRATLSRLFTEAYVEPFGPRHPLGVRVNGLELASSTICYLDHPGGLRAIPRAPMGCHSIQYPLTGKAEFNVEGRICPVDKQRGGMVSEGQQIRKVELMPKTGMLCFNVKDDVLRQIATSVTGRTDLPGIRFDPGIDWSSPHIATMLVLLKTTATELDRQDGLIRSPAALTSIEHALTTLLLFGLKHNLANEINKPGRNAGLNKVRLVEEYISTHAAESIDMQTIAHVTGHSVNSIFRAFQKYRDYTPIQFLRAARLDKARQRLLLAETVVSVSDIALSCGFSHLGRFAADYKRRFGESPSETARRVRKLQS